MKSKLTPIIVIAIFFLSCKEKKETVNGSNPTPTFKNEGKEMVYKMVEKVGNYKTLRDKKDVVYTYTYTTPDGKSDVSSEKYVFNGELSYGAYHKHERTFPELEGFLEQGYDGNNFWLKHNGTILTDSTHLKRVAFSRPTNFYWFTMFQKLMDPGLNYEYLETKMINNKTYDVVKISFQSTNNKPTDIYQLYINKETQLVDQFLFTVADFGMMETPNLMLLEYEEVEGMLIPTKRKYKKSTWNAYVSPEPWIYVIWTDIKFNNGLSKNDFTK